MPGWWLGGARMVAGWCPGGARIVATIVGDLVPRMVAGLGSAGAVPRMVPDSGAIVATEGSRIVSPPKQMETNRHRTTFLTSTDSAP